MRRSTRPTRNARLRAIRRRKATALAALMLVLGAISLRNFLLRSPTPASAGFTATGLIDASDEQVAPPRGGTVRIEWPATRGRDPFTFDRSAYVTIAEPEPVPAAPQAPVGPSDEEIARRELEKLVLQATVDGDLPRAVINGRNLRPGDTVGGFTVVEIGTRSVTLRYRSVEVALEM